LRCADVAAHFIPQKPILSSSKQTGLQAISHAIGLVDKDTRAE
jgi:hypothetical protein